MFLEFGKRLGEIFGLTQRKDRLKWRLSLKLGHKIFLCLLGMVLSLCLIFWGLLHFELDRTLRQYNDSLGSSLARQTANAVRELVLANDLLGLNVALNQLSGDLNVEAALVFDVEGELLAASDSASPLVGANGGVYEAPITVQDAVAGTVQVRLNVEASAASFRRARHYFWLLLGGGALLAAALAVALAAHIAKPVLEVARGLTRRDEAETGMAGGRSDELGQLQDAAGEMLAEYRKVASWLGPAEISRRADENRRREPTKLPGSVLAMQVVNIDAAIELLHPVTLADLLNEGLHYLSQAAGIYRGSVSGKAGESALAAFDVRASGDRHSLDAVHCAKLFLMLTREVNRFHKEQGRQSLEYGLAIHSGSLFLMPPLGSDGDKEAPEAVMGKDVETARALCQQGKPGQLSISETTFIQAKHFERLEVDGQIEITTPMDKAPLKVRLLKADEAAASDPLKRQCEHLLRDLRKES